MKRLLRAVMGALLLILLVAPAASAAPDFLPGGGCDGPPPANPSRGVAGWLAPDPDPIPDGADPFVAGSHTSIYEQYGLAPFKWNTCDLNSRWVPDAASAGSTVGTTVANWIMLIPILLIALYAALASVALHPETWVTMLRPAMTTTVDSLYQALTLPAARFVFLALSILILWWALRGRSHARALTSLGLIAVIGLGLGFVVGDPFRIIGGGSEIAPAAVGAINNEVNSSAAGQDVKDPAVAVTSNVTDAILYQRWLAGMFGDTSSKAAKELGPRLFKASALNWEESLRASGDPKACQNHFLTRGIATASCPGSSYLHDKQDAYKAAMSDLNDMDPGAYEYATGRDATNRVGQALIALLAALCALPFLIMSMILLLAVPIVLLVAIVMFVAGGILGVFSGQASRFLMGPLKMAGAAVINAIIFGAAATVQVLGTNIVLAPDSKIPSWLGIILALIMTVILWKATKPQRKLADMAGYHGKRSYEKAKGGYNRGGKMAAGVQGWLVGRAMSRHNGDSDDEDGPDQTPDAAPAQPSERPGKYDQPLIPQSRAIPEQRIGPVYAPDEKPGPEAPPKKARGGVHSIYTAEGGEPVRTAPEGTPANPRAAAPGPGRDDAPPASPQAAAAPDIPEAKANEEGVFELWSPIAADPQDDEPDVFVPGDAQRGGR